MPESVTLDLLQGLEAEDGPPLVTLATLAADGSPRARMLVVRHFTWGGDESIVFCSDARSEKNEQLRRDPRAEAVAWASKRRTQYRLRGRCEIEKDENDRLEIWEQIGDNARALFTWPKPKDKRAADDAFAEKASKDAPMPDNFEVLRLTIDTIDRLDLSQSPHRRTLLTWNGENWDAREVNP